MTTFDAKGRMTSCFRPPMKDGKPMSACEWRISRALKRLADGEDRMDIERDLASEIGESIVWHGWGSNSEEHADSIRLAIKAVREASGFGNPPQLRGKRA